MNNEIFDNLINLDENQIQAELKDMDASQVFSLFKYIEIETGKKFHEYKIQDKGFWDNLVDKFITSEEEQHLWNFYYMLAIICDEVCERVANNIYENTKIFVENKKESSKDTIGYFLEFAKELDKEKLNNIISNEIFEKFNKINLELNNIDKEIELNIDKIYDTKNLKLLQKFDFNNDKITNDNQNKEINEELKDSFGKALNSAFQVGIGVVLGGQDGAIESALENSNEIFDATCGIVKNSYKKIENWNNSDRQANIKVIQQMLDYAEIIDKVLNVDIKKIFKNFNDQKEKIKRQKIIVKSELEKLESLISDFNSDDNYHIQVLINSINLTQEMQNLLKDNILEHV